MPRLSRAAANADIRQLANDFSLGVRLSTLALVPVAAVMTAFGDVLVSPYFRSVLGAARAQNGLA
nr:lipid II flippase MurJ [Pseudonocardia sp. ICBG1142]